MKRHLITTMIIGIVLLIMLIISIVFLNWVSIIIQFICSVVYVGILISIIKSYLLDKKINKEDFSDHSIDAYEYFMQTMCDACGKNHKAPNSQLCKECQEKVSERYKDWW